MPVWGWVLAAVALAAVASALLVIAAQVGSTRTAPEREHARRTREVIELNHLYEQDDQAPIGETDV